MGIFQQLGDGLRLARYVPLRTILKNGRRQRRIKRLVREHCLFLCLHALRRSGLAGDCGRGDVRFHDGQKRPGLDPDVVNAVTEYLYALKLIGDEKNGKEGAFRLTRSGRNLLASPAGFADLIAGYEPVLERLPGLLRAEPEARSARRDEALIREASTSLGFDLAYPVVSGMIRKYGVRSVLELGSSRLAQLKYLCDRNGVTGWGVDIDALAVADSRASLRGTVYQDRIRVVEGDALTPETVNVPAAEIGAIVAVDLLHYYLRDRRRVVSALAGWRKKMPSSLFLIVEICRIPGRAATQSPLPKPEYNLCHRLTGQALPTERDWLDVFGAAGYRQAEKHVFPSLEHGAFVFSNGERPA